MGCQCGKNSVLQQDADGREPVAPRAKPVSSEVLDKKVAQAKKTGVLALRECGLKQLPPAAIGSDTASLRTVDLTANALQQLPEEIGAWLGLQQLLCAQNSLSMLPAALASLGGLQKLVLSRNRLRDLGPELAPLGRLKALQLDDNRLGPRLPAAAFSGAIAGALEELDLAGNALQDLPASLAGLGVLARLSVARNQLVELPEVLGALRRLQHLDAADNRLSAVPPALLQDTSLSELWLRGNPVDRLELQKMPGFASFLERRKQRIDARIDSHVVGAVNLAVCGLD